MPQCDQCFNCECQPDATRALTPLAQALDDYNLEMRRLNANLVAMYNALSDTPTADKVLSFLSAATQLISPLRYNIKTAARLIRELDEANRA